MVMHMWIRGYKLKYKEVPPYYICEEIKKQVKDLAIIYDAKFKGSMHSEACYLKFGDVVVSFRNHPSGKTYDYEIYLSDFKSWDACVKYFEKYVLKKIKTAQQ